MIGVILKVVQLVFMWQSRYKVEDQEKVVALNLKREESRWQRLKREYGRSFLLCFSRSDENQWPKRPSERMFYDGTQANENFKLFLGYAGALIVAAVLCVFFVFKQPWDPRIIGIVCGVVIMALSYGMFFSSVRCWFLLMIPEFMSSRCRAVIILLALGWTLSGPVLNTQMNLRLTAETVNCLHEQVGREGQNLKTTLKNLLLSKANKFFLAKKAIELFMFSIKSSFQVIFNALNRLVNIVKKTFGWMKALVGKCNSETQSTYQVCCDKVEKVNKNCKYYLGKIYIGWLCPIITLSGDYVCGFFKISQYLCSIPQAMQEQFQKHVLDRLKSVLEKAIDKVERAFNFEVRVSKNYTFNETFISNATEFKRKVQEEISYIRDRFSFIGGLCDLLIYVAFLRLMVSAFIYRRKYLTKLRYDNYFLTQELFNEDLKKSLLGKETAMPLTPKETKMYIFACSCRMTKSEIWRMIASFTTLTISFFFIGFWLIFDWATWFCLSEQYRLLMELGGVEVPNFFKLHVQGSGMMAKVYKYLLSAIAPETFKGDLVKRWQICIEEPSIPDFELHKNIYIMMLICYITLPIGVYLARLRHVICYLFYPEQEIKRAIELQNMITVLRGSWLYFLQKAMDDKKSIVGAVKQRLFVSVPLLGKIVGLIGDEMKTCTECYEQVKVADINNYRTCENAQCGQVFCINCHYKSPNCTRCQQPKVPKGMIISYEMPQSEETMYQFAANQRKKYDKDIVMQQMGMEAKKLLKKGKRVKTERSARKKPSKRVVSKRKTPRHASPFAKKIPPSKRPSIKTAPRKFLPTSKKLFKPKKMMLKRLPTTTTTAASSLAPSTSYFDDVRPTKKRAPAAAILPLTKKVKMLKRFQKPPVKTANKSKKKKAGIDKDEEEEREREQILAATQQNELPSTSTSSVSGTPGKHTTKRRSKSPDSSPPTKRTKKTKRK